eukprot:CFRG2324T1
MGSFRSTCDCPTGFNGPNCTEVECNNGYLTSGTDYECTCEPDWSGFLCGNCRTDNACKYYLGTSSATCRQNVSIGVGKVVSSCEALDNGLKSALNGDTPVLQIVFQPANAAGNLTGSMQVFKGSSATSPLLPVFSCHFEDCQEYPNYVEECTLLAQEPVTDPTSAYICNTFSCRSECEAKYDFCVDAIKAMLQTAKAPMYFVANSTYINIRQSTLELLAPCGVHLVCNRLATSCIEGDQPQPTTKNKTTAAAFILVENKVNFGDVVAIAVALFCGALSILTFIVSILAYLSVRDFYNLKIISSTTLYNEDLPIQDLGGVHQPLAFLNVGYKINCNHLLQGVAGVVEPGELVAVLGPSGAGKSSTLDILAGRRKRGVVVGEIWAMGSKVKEQTLRQNVGFVDQEYIPMPTLTVTECLMYSSMLRLPNSTSMYVRKKRVEAIMRNLRIMHVSHQRIGNSIKRGISGGELRRLSIAAELVTSPALLYLDEPTSSLDSYNAHVVVECLKSLAVNTRTMIVMTIHQPSSRIYKMFDKIMLLTKGKMVYFGPAEEIAPSHFSSLGVAECPSTVNVADFLMDTLVEAEVNSAKAERTSCIKDTDSTISSMPTEPGKPSKSQPDYTRSEKTNMLNSALTTGICINSYYPTKSGGDINENQSIDGECDQQSTRDDKSLSSITNLSYKLAECSPLRISSDSNTEGPATNELTIQALQIGYAKSSLAMNMSTKATVAIAYMRKAIEKRKAEKRMSRKKRKMEDIGTITYNTQDDTTTNVDITNDEHDNTLASSNDIPEVTDYDVENIENITTKCNIFKEDGAKQNRTDLNQKVVSTRATFWTQTLTLSHRTLANLRRDPHLIIGHWTVGAMTGIVLGLLYYNSGVSVTQNDLNGQIISEVQQQLGALLLLCAFLSFGGLTSLEIFETERVLFLHERANGFYTAGAFYVSKLLFDVVLLRIVPPIITGTIFYFLMKMRNGFIHFLVFVTVLTLCNLTAASLCMLVGLAVRNRALALLLASLLILLSLALTNMFNNGGSVGTWSEWLHYLSFFNYAYEALVINELKDLTFQGVALGTTDIAIEANLLLDELGFDTNKL